MGVTLLMTQERDLQGEKTDLMTKDDKTIGNEDTIGLYMGVCINH